MKNTFKENNKNSNLLIIIPGNLIEFNNLLYFNPNFIKNQIFSIKKLKNLSSQELINSTNPACEVKLDVFPQLPRKTLHKFVFRVIICGLEENLFQKNLNIKGVFSDCKRFKN